MKSDFHNGGKREETIEKIVPKYNWNVQLRIKTLVSYRIQLAIQVTAFSPKMLAIFNGL